MSNEQDDQAKARRFVRRASEETNADERERLLRRAKRLIDKRQLRRLKRKYEIEDED